MESEHATEKSQLNEQLSSLTKNNNEINIELEKTKGKHTQVNMLLLSSLAAIHKNVVLLKYNIKMLEKPYHDSMNSESYCVLLYSLH